MYRKYFFKNKGVLSRRFVASGLAAVFSAGMFGSYAVAMEMNVNQEGKLLNTNKQSKLPDLNEDECTKEKARGLAEYFLKGRTVKEVLNSDLGPDNLLSHKAIEIFGKNEEFFLDFVTEVILYYFEFKKNENCWIDFESFFDYVRQNNKVTLNTISSYLLSNNTLQLIIAKYEDYISKISSNINDNVQNKKNKLFSKEKLIVLIVFVVVVIILVLKGKSNTGVPNNNKDDGKVNPSTDPESDEQNPEQKKQEQESIVGSVETANLKAVGASVFLGGGLAGVVTYLVNEVLLKSGKPSEVKNSRNVDNMYLDSDGNKVTKTEGKEKAHNNYVADNENVDNSGKNRLLEDKDTEEKEEGQEEILESSALSDDTEATSDEDKNKD